MADPVTIAAVVSMGAAAGGSILGAFGSEQQGQAQANMYQYKAGVAQINQQIMKQNADFMRKSGEVEAQQSGMKTEFQIGATKAAQGASNLDVNSGSAVGVRESERDEGLEDQALIRSNAARRAFGYETEAVGQEAESKLDVSAAGQVKKAADINAVSSILGGASSVSSKWIAGSQAGMFK